MTHTPTLAPAAAPAPEPIAARPPLIIAGHGTREPAGVAACLALVERVRTLLPGVRVEAGFVELTPPTIDSALDRVLAEGAGAAVVVPLMIGRGGHVQADIPDAIAAGRRPHPEATVVYTRHLGSPPALVSAAVQRIDAARGDWPAAETAVVFIGRGCSVIDANADHVRLARVVAETGGYARVEPAFVQVVSPTPTEGLAAAYASGARRIVVMPHYLFPGRLEAWVRREVARWASEHPDADTRVADVLGDCPELAGVVAQRYREGELRARTDLGTPAYLTGLLLRGRRAVAVGGGCVNRRRVPQLLAAGADVTVIAPDLHPALAELAARGRVTWERRGYEASDLDGAWFVLAATDSPALNASIAADAEARHTFCVRADRGASGSAWTPATATLGRSTVAVLSEGDPGRSKAVRDRIVQQWEATQ